jgi:hypothetical protein
MSANMSPDAVDYPFPVVYSTESGGYRRANVDEVSAQLRGQARQAMDYRAWQRRQRTDDMDKVWARYRDFVSMVERAPFPPKRNMRSWDLRQGRTRKAIPADTVLTFVGRDPSNYVASDRVQW